MSSRFYGRVSGNRGTGGAQAWARDNLLALAASWQGAVTVGLEPDPETGDVRAIVKLIPWDGQGTERVLYDGPVSG